MTWIFETSYEEWDVKTMVKKSMLLCAVCMCMNGTLVYSQGQDVSKQIDKQTFNTGSVLWYNAPAKAWEDALPVGNGRLGAMVFGMHGKRGSN